MLVSHPDVREAHVFPYRHPLRGEVVAAAIVADGTYQDARPVAANRHCRARLARHKRPFHVFFLHGLPRTPLGKVNQPALLALIERMEHGEPQELP